MLRVLAVTAAIGFLAPSAIAQTRPCSAALDDRPVFAVVLGNPVLLSFQHTTSGTLTPPSVSVVGHEITASQSFSAALPAENCNSQSASLGQLPPGQYTVTWNYQALESAGPVPPVATFPFAFTVPDTAPCVRGIDIQPPSPVAGQPVGIAYSIPYRGFIQPPAVTIDAGQITIDQPAAIADPVGPGNVPCGRGTVAINSLQPGFYAVIVRSFGSIELTGSFTVRSATRSRAVRPH